MNCRRSSFLIAVVLCVAGGSIPSSAENIIFPRNKANIIDVTRPPYNIDKTGTTDVADTLTKILKANNKWVIIYLPNGTYRVSKTVSFQLCPGICNGSAGLTGPILQGQSCAGTVIKLDAGSFTNASAPMPVVNTGDGVAQNFNRGLHNLTVLVGPNNPGAVGVHWYSNNEGLMSNVNIIAMDTTPSCGLDLTGPEQGPCGARDIRVQGFKIGVKSNALNSVTLYRLSIVNQIFYGVYNQSNFLYIDSLTSVNTVPAVVNQGDLALIRASLTGGSSQKFGIISTTRLYSRAIHTEGYKAACSTSIQKLQPPFASDLNEYISDSIRCNFPNSIRHSLMLPLPTLPDVPWESDTTKWANIEVLKGGFGFQLSDQAAFQKGLDSASITTMLIPFGKDYNLTDTAWVRGKTQRIVGGAGNFMSTTGLGAIVIVDAPGASPVVRIEKLLGTNIINRSSRTVIVESYLGEVDVMGAGETYIFDAVLKLQAHGAQARTYAWQFNAECCAQYNAADRNNLYMTAGDVWIFGWKGEGNGTKVHCYGGRCEVLGFMQYNNTWNTAMAGIPLMVANNAQFTSACVGQIKFGTTTEFYDVLVRETRAGQTLDMDAAKTGTGYALFSGASVDKAELPAPASAARDFGFHSSISVAGIRVEYSAPEGGRLQLIGMNGRIIDAHEISANRPIGACVLRAFGNGVYVVRLTTPSRAMEKAVVKAAIGR